MTVAVCATGFASTLATPGSREMADSTTAFFLARNCRPTVSTGRAKVLSCPADCAAMLDAEPGRYAARAAQ